MRRQTVFERTTCVVFTDLVLIRALVFCVDIGRDSRHSPVRFGSVRFGLVCRIPAVGLIFWLDHLNRFPRLTFPGRALSQRFGGHSLNHPFPIPQGYYLGQTRVSKMRYILGLSSLLCLFVSYFYFFFSLPIFRTLDPSPSPGRVRAHEASIHLSPVVALYCGQVGAARAVSPGDLWGSAPGAAEDVAQARRVPDVAEPSGAGQHAVFDAPHARRTGGLDGRGGKNGEKDDIHLKRRIRE